MKPSFDASHDTLSYDNLYAGDFPRKTATVTILSGEGALVRGAVLGKQTVGGKFRLSVPDPTPDGSQVARAILAEDVDATSGDVVALVYLTGEYAQEKLTFGSGHTAATTFWDLAGVGIFLRETVAE